MNMMNQNKHQRIRSDRDNLGTRYQVMLSLLSAPNVEKCSINSMPVQGVCGLSFGLQPKISSGAKIKVVRRGWGDFGVGLLFFLLLPGVQGACGAADSAK